ncbi:MAG: FTR1 family iron permease [Gemmatimonadetes bacterium]|nr:FTR1 family iron permease [Gemmatimonadota bacterium]
MHARRVTASLSVVMALAIASAPGSGAPQETEVRAQRASNGAGAATEANATGFEEGIYDWLARVESTLRELLETDLPAAEWTSRILRSYLDAYEPLEAWYGPGGPHATPALSPLVAQGEQQFHVLLAARETDALRRESAVLLERVAGIRAVAVSEAVRRVPDPGARAASITATADRRGDETIVRTAEIRALVAAFRAARDAFDSGDRAAALAAVEEAYLQQIEPLEPRLPGVLVRRIESLIHLDLRPAIARDAARRPVAPIFTALDTELQLADAALASSGSFGFAAFNAFAIIVREGLEAVLLVAALLAYLSGMGAERRERRRIWVGVALGLGATALTWVLARTIVPVSGAGRELLEGVTALIAVAVLVYVSHWLFHKSYIHDWKTYLRDRIGRAMTAGSALAMAGLAFAAVYREGFETVLFYQALLLDAGGTAVLAGFVPGFVLIALVGTLVIRLGVRLPLKRLFGMTNAILLWLALVFLGKGLYNLQEAGVFAPTPIRWLPDHPVLQQVLGFHPLVETVLAQLAFVAFIAVTFAFHRRRLQARRNEPALARDPRPERIPA